MTPNEINALPTIRTEPWGDASRTSLRDLFNIDSYDLNEELMEGVECRIYFDEKLHLYSGPDDSTNITAVTFDGDLIAITARYPGSRDYDTVHVVDVDGLRKARAHAQEFVRTPENFVVVDPDDDISDISGLYANVHTMPDGEVRLVHYNHLDSAGNLIYDEVRFRAEFDRVVRPMFEGRFEETKNGIRNLELRSAVLDCIDAAIPDGIPRLRLDEANSYDDVVAYVLDAPDGSVHEVFWSRWNHGSYFSWITPSLRCRG